MNRNPKTVAKLKIPSKVQKSFSEPIRLARRGDNTADLWKSFVIGGLAIGGVFAYLEFTKLAPEPSPQAAVATAKTTTKTPLVANIEPLEEDSPVPKIVDAVIPAPKTSDGLKPEESTVPVVNQAELIAKEAILVLTDLDSQRENAIRRDKELFHQAMAGKAWEAYRGLLAKSIDAGLAKLGKGQGVNRFDLYWKEPILYQAFLRWQVLGRFSESEISAHAFDEYTGEFVTWLFGNSGAMEELLLTIKPSDDAGKVLEFLMTAWPNTKDKMDKYFPLALACAVVFDREVDIPHPIGGKDGKGKESTVVPIERYLWFIEKNEKGLLAAPIHRSSARDLVWVVCAPVSTFELEWSLDKMHFRQKNWGNAFGKIEYLMERAVEGLNPYKEYSFAEILKEGGICGDQSYFCANTARAQGIPAMILTGETDLGGHAWVGLKIQSDEWTTGVGRVGGVSKGETENPQTGSQITEQEVQLWNDRFHQSPLVTLSVARHLWLADYFAATGETEQNAEVVRLANQIGPSFVETWGAMYEMLKQQMKLTGDPAQPSNLEEWKKFAQEMRREFKDNPRMAALAARAENEYIFPYGEKGDAFRTLQRERRGIARESGEQKDLIAESLKREAELIHKRGDANAKKDISNLYDSALRKYGGSITGFKMMADDYFSYFREDRELGHKAARDIELAFKRVVETGTKDWFRAKTEASIYTKICGYYRASGDEERAIMLEKRYEVLLKRAERSAL